jgi:hypothetical protein
MSSQQEMTFHASILACRRPAERAAPVARKRDTGVESGDMFLMKGYQWSDSKKAQYGGELQSNYTTW